MTKPNPWQITTKPIYDGLFGYSWTAIDNTVTPPFRARGFAFTDLRAQAKAWNALRDHLLSTRPGLANQIGLSA